MAVDDAAYQTEKDSKNTYNASSTMYDTSKDATTIPAGQIDPVYEAKARVLNRAIQDIGTGWYQWQLFVVVGFGWASDNLWPIVTSLILTPVTNEFRVTRPPFLTLAQNIGLLAGAVFWGKFQTSILLIVSIPKLTT